MLAFIAKILGYVGQAVGVVKAVDPALLATPVGTEVLNILNQSQIELTDFLNGQAVVVATFTEQGKPGTLVAVLNGGPAATSLGL